MLRKARWLLIANMLLVVALVLGACGAPAPPPPADTPVPPAPGETPEPEPTTPPPPPPPTEVKNPGTLIYASYGEPDSLDPNYQYDTASYSIIFNVYEGLLFYDRESYTEFVPVLAEEMPEVSDDMLTYTFKIREGIKFHEGGDFTPEDVAYSFWRIMIQDRAGGPAWIVLEPLTGEYAIDDIAEEMGDEAACEFIKSTVEFDNENFTVTFHLAAPFGPFLNILASGWGGAIMDKEWVAEIGGWDGDCANWRDWNDPDDVESELYSAMNGTGPFIFDHWTPGDEIVVVRNDDYWRDFPLWEGGKSGPATIERGVWKFVDEWGTRYAMFEAGDADIVQVDRQYTSQADELTREQWDAIDTSDPSKMTILHEDGIARSFIGLPELAAADVFFNQGVNVEGGNPYLGSGEMDGNGIPPDFFSDIHVRNAFNYCFDFDTFIEEAWLGEAIRHRGPIIAGHIGYTEDSEIFSYDLAKCEEEFKLAWDGELWDIGFYLVSTYNSGNDQRRTAAEIIEANVEGINPNFSISVLDVPWPTYLDEMVGGRLPLFIIGWVEDYHHPHNWVLPYMHPAGTWAQFQNLPQEQYDRYEAKTQECLELPFEDAAPCYEEMQAMAMEDVLDLFMTQPIGREYFQNWVDGFFFNPVYPDPMWIYRFTKE